MSKYEQIQRLVADAQEGYSCPIFVPRQGSFRHGSYLEPDKCFICLLTAAYVKHHNIKDQSILEVDCCQITEWAEAEYGITWNRATEVFDSPNRACDPIYQPIIEYSKELFPSN